VRKKNAKARRKSKIKIHSTRSVTRAFVDTPKGQIHYRIAGKGTTVLLLHQTPRSSDEFLEVLPELASAGFRAIAMDTIGFGDSYKPMKRNLTVADLGSGVIDFLDAMKIKRTNLVGHHTGAVIAIEVATSFPDRVDKLVLSACPYMDDEKRRNSVGKPVMDEDKEMEDGSHLISLWRRRMAFYPRKNRSDLLRRFIIDALLAGENRTQGHKAVREYRLEKKYGQIKTPTLLVCGTKDPYAYPVMGKISSLIRGSRMIPLRNGTVPLPNQLPKEFANAIIPFLEE
jgi:pimeloyl-ACP methyl ester carboxylesterase